ncbi:AAA-domain-containing protein [Poronia punctata]|nr:AAA-domain-containing protein [Poronia punctata]
MKFVLTKYYVALQSHAVVRSDRAPIYRMNNQWLRALRSAAKPSRQTALLSRPAGRLYSTTPGLTPDDASNAPAGEGQKHEDGNPTAANREIETAEEDILNDEPVELNDNGETNERKRHPTSKGRKSRAVRNNKKAEMPSVQLPKDFLKSALTRYDEANRPNHWLREHTSEVASTNLNADEIDALVSAIRNDHLFTAASWARPTVEEAIEALRSGGDIGPIIRRMDLLGVSAYLTVLHQIKKAAGDEAHLKLLAEVLPQTSPGWVSKLLQEYTKNQDPSAVLSPQFIRLLVDHVVEDGEIPLTKVALFEPCILDEIVSAVRADLLIGAPENTRPAGLHRPATIVNIPDCSGFSVAADTLQYIADQVQADVLHVRASDIAYIVGRYVGQDVTRTPGDISLLGYKTAEISGRLKERPTAEEDSEDPEGSDATFTFMVQNAKQRKEPGRRVLSMEDFLQHSATRGKSEELWEDMKVKVAVDELLHSADGDTAEHKPLIVHIHDFNALDMDETGSTMLGKIRKVVDEFWLSGRKVALVGTCSTNDAPKPYQAALLEMESSERVVHLSRRYLQEPEAREKCAAALALWEKQDNLRENDENLVRVLGSMMEMNKPATYSEATLGLSKKYGDATEQESTSGFQLPSHWSGVLPLAEIYRTATVMIGSNTTGTAGLFTLDCFEKAVTKMVTVDAARERAARLQKLRDVRGEGPTGKFKTGSSTENHEEKLLSGLVNAKDMRTTFKDIHAPKETIESIKMLTTLSLIRPEAFSYGVLASDRIPGCLLYGPPGTGKTLLAKAVAKESGANMIEISGASINNMYVGESEKNVRALFRLAKKKQPMVIFIDEADALLGARGGHQNESRRETINQFLREWDGMDKMKAFIMVATNRPFDLDEAVLRRLPRKLLIDLPLEADRIAILKIHLKEELIDNTITLEELAKRTPLYSGSDLKNVCVAAAMAAVKEELEASERHTGPDPYSWTEKRVLSRRHFDKALKEIGASSSEDMSTLTAIRKFDERYGDNKDRKKRKGMGFEVMPEAVDSDPARVRSAR